MERLWGETGTCSESALQANVYFANGGEEGATAMFTFGAFQKDAKTNCQDGPRVGRRSLAPPHVPKSEPASAITDGVM